MPGCWGSSSGPLFFRRLLVYRLVLPPYNSMLQGRLRAAFSFLTQTDGAVFAGGALR